jgi:hypothetical protein
LFLVRPCPSCNTALKIPRTRGILFIRCPVCEYRFEFDAEDPKLEWTDSKRYTQSIWNQWKASSNQNIQNFLKKLFPKEWNRESWNKIIPALLFLILFFYISRDLWSPDQPIPDRKEAITEKENSLDPKSPAEESLPPAFPENEPPHFRPEPNSDSENPNPQPNTPWSI